MVEYRAKSAPAHLNFPVEYWPRPPADVAVVVVVDAAAVVVAVAASAEFAAAAPVVLADPVAFAAHHVATVVAFESPDSAVLVAYAEESLVASAAAFVAVAVAFGQRAYRRDESPLAETPSLSHDERAPPSAGAFREYNPWAPAVVHVQSVAVSEAELAVVLAADAPPELASVPLSVRAAAPSSAAAVVGCADRVAECAIGSNAAQDSVVDWVL